MYIKEAFQVESLEKAKHVVLSSNEDDNEKFQRETDYSVSVIKEKVDLSEESLVLDFGCGMGRIAKELIEQFNCTVFGVDISKSMLHFAKQYVNNTRFFPLSTYTLKNTIDVCISIFCLQHVESPAKEIDNLVDVLKPNGYFILLNEHKRFVPTNVDKERYVIWENDGFDVIEYVKTKLTLIEIFPYFNKVNHHFGLYKKI